MRSNCLDNDRCLQNKPSDSPWLLHILTRHWPGPRSLIFLPASVIIWLPNLHCRFSSQFPESVRFMLVLFLSSVQTRCSRQDCSQIWFCFVFCIQYQGIFLSLVLLGNAYVMIHILGRCSRFTATTLISSVQKKRKEKTKTRTKKSHVL